MKSVLFTVEDTGIGMSDKQLDNLGQEYSTSAGTSHN